MKFSPAAATVFAVLSYAAPVENSIEASTTTWSLVPLEAPLNWIAGSQLFPADVISGYHANLKAYAAQSWSAHVLQACQNFTAATSSITYSAINSGTPKVRYWFGYCFRGGATTQVNYTRDNGVQHSIAYTVGCS